MLALTLELGLLRAFLAVLAAELAVPAARFDLTRARRVGAWFRGRCVCHVSSWISTAALCGQAGVRGCHHLGFSPEPVVERVSMFAPAFLEQFIGAGSCFVCVPMTLPLRLRCAQSAGHAVPKRTPLLPYQHVSSAAQNVIVRRECCRGPLLPGRGGPRVNGRRCGARTADVRHHACIVAFSSFLERFEVHILGSSFIYARSRGLSGRHACALALRRAGRRSKQERPTKAKLGRIHDYE